MSSSPAWKLTSAAASARSVRRPASAVSPRARCRNAAAAATPPRACARPAHRSSSSSDRLVGSEGGCSQMPCPTVWIDIPIGRLGQCEVHTPALIRWRGSVDRGAHQRMPEPHGLLDREQPIRGVSRRDIDPEPLGCTPDEHRVTDRLGSGDEQQEPRTRAESLQLGVESCSRAESATLAVGRPTGRNRRQAAPRSSRGAARAARADCRASRRRCDHGPARRDGHMTAERRSARASPFRSPRTSISGSPRRSPVRLARRKEKSDGLGQEPPRDEGERLGRHLVQPLRVVDDTQDRTLLRSPRQQRQDRQPDEESIRRRPRGPAERDLECVALWRRELLHGVEQGRTELVQGRERQLHLRLDTRGV